jgi:hypothetical protein
MKEFLKKLTDLGLPLIWIRDPFTKLPSVSLTLVIVSCFYLQAAILSNFLVCLKGINGDLASNFFLAASGLYFGRKLSMGKSTGGIEKE